MDITNQCTLDVETRSRCPIDYGAFAYAANSSTDLLCAAYTIENEEPIGFFMDDKIYHKRFFEFVMDGGIIHAHNFLFEIAIMKYVGVPKYKWPKPKINQFRCTMQMCGRAGLPLRLEDAAKALNITHKLESGKSLLKLFSIPQSNGSFIELNSRPKEKQQLLEYCIVDCIVCRDIVRNLPAWKDEEVEDILFDLKSNLNGVPIDSKVARIINDNVLIEQKSFGEKASHITNGVITKMTQVQRLKHWVQNNVSDDIPNCSADTIVDILSGKYGEVDSSSEELLLMRQHSGKSSTGKYTRYITSNIDDRIHGMIISFGAHTGRSISKLLNLYNLPKPSIKYESMEELINDLSKDDIEYINEKYGSYLKAASTAIRGIISAIPGNTLCIADYSSIEARAVFWLADCTTGLRAYENDIDLYIDMATTVYGVRYKDVNDSQRWMGKQLILGAGFGLGGKGFVNSCARWGVVIEEKLAINCISAYRTKYPEVTEMWNEIEESALRACRTGKVVVCCQGKISFKTNKTISGIVMLQMKLPSGRCVNYPDVKLQMVTKPWGDRGVAVTYKKLFNGQWLRESTYGGKLTENAVQGIARDIMYYGAKMASQAGHQIHFTVYDEIIGEIDSDKADIKEFCRLITLKPDWANGFPLAAEGELHKRYQKL